MTYGDVESCWDEETYEDADDALEAWVAWGPSVLGMRDCTQWLASAVGKPSFFMAAATGFGAGCLTHCEMYGLPCFYVTLITDSHSVTTESMQAYSPILTHLGLPADTDEIFMKPSFRPILKEANTRGNAIFS